MTKHPTKYESYHIKKLREVAFTKWSEDGRTNEHTNWKNICCTWNRKSLSKSTLVYFFKNTNHFPWSSLWTVPYFQLFTDHTPCNHLFFRLFLLLFWRFCGICLKINWNIIKMYNLLNYNYPCIRQCLSPLKLWVRILLMVRFPLLIKLTTTIKLKYC